MCYLLAAGLTETAVKVLAGWTSDMVRWYGHRLVLDPELVQPWPFYNPGQGLYTFPAAGGRRDTLGELPEDDTPSDLEDPYSEPSSPLTPERSLTVPV